MKIGLLDVDSHNFPNLPLMKLSAYHKASGDDVEKYDSMRWLNPYDRVYQSKIFTFTEDYKYNIYANEVVKGGTGYGLNTHLPDEVEHMYPDYELYGISDTAYGFLTRGCPRACSFCIVSEKEGRKSVKVADLSEFWRGQKEIKLLDPNLFASSEWKDLSNQLIQSKSWVDFTQGVDIRVMTDEKVDLISQMKVKMLHFAWDNYEFSTYDKLKQFRDSFNVDYRKLKVYVLTNFNTTIEQDLERIYKLRELQYDPYLMIYDKHNANRELRKMQRWVNNRMIWRTCERFEDYKTG